jgi:hypothetical protein
MFVHDPGSDARGRKPGIRSHVTKEYHRQKRLQRTLALAAKVPSCTDTLPMPPDISHRDSPEDSQAADAGKISLLSDRRDLERLDPMLLEEDLSSSKSDYPPLSLNRQLCSTILCHQPFRQMLGLMHSKYLASVPLDQLSQSLHGVLLHALFTTWPSTVPAKDFGLQNPITHIWLQSALEYPVVMHAFLYAACIHLQLDRAGEEGIAVVEGLGLALKSEAYRLIRQHLQDLQRPPSDALIMAVATMAVHGSVENECLGLIQATSPLSRQQYLHIYGRLVPAQEHMDGLYTLVRLKGGLQAVRTYAMPEALAL